MLKLAKPPIRLPFAAALFIGMLLVFQPLLASAAAQRDLPPISEWRPKSKPIVRSVPARSAPKPALKPATGAKSPAGPKPVGTAAKNAAVRPEWLPLIARLRKDGLYTKQVAEWFLLLDSPYSQRPMGGKIQGLFLARYRPFGFLRKPVETPPLLPYVFTVDNVRKCVSYLGEHATVFEAAEKKLQVEKELVAALLMVETRLGTYLGKEPAFWSLACMAVAGKRDKVGEYLKGLRVTPARGIWVDETLAKRSDWAYKELAALLRYCARHGHDPFGIRGSPWGAIGYCQFMPSNIDAYAMDGDGDGRIDLFSVADSIFSTASYIRKHGWKPGIARERRHAVVLRYNHSDAYANTVLALSEAVGEASKK